MKKDGGWIGDEAAMDMDRSSCSTRWTISWTADAASLALRALFILHPPNHRAHSTVLQCWPLKMIRPHQNTHNHLQI